MGALYFLPSPFLPSCCASGPDDGGASNPAVREEACYATAVTRWPLFATGWINRKSSPHTQCDPSLRPVATPRVRPRPPGQLWRSPIKDLSSIRWACSGIHTRIPPAIPRVARCHRSSMCTRPHAQCPCTPSHHGKKTRRSWRNPTWSFPRAVTPAMSAPTYLMRPTHQLSPVMIRLPHGTTARCA